MGRSKINHAFRLYAGRYGPDVAGQFLLMAKRAGKGTEASANGYLSAWNSLRCMGERGNKNCQRKWEQLLARARDGVKVGGSGDEWDFGGEVPCLRVAWERVGADPRSFFAALESFGVSELLGYDPAGDPGGAREDAVPGGDATERGADLGEPSGWLF